MKFQYIKQQGCLRPDVLVLNGSSFGQLYLQPQDLGSNERITCIGQGDFNVSDIIPVLLDQADFRLLLLENLDVFNRVFLSRIRLPLKPYVNIRAKLIALTTRQLLTLVCLFAIFRSNKKLRILNVICRCTDQNKAHYMKAYSSFSLPLLIKEIMNLLPESYFIQYIPYESKMLTL